MGTYTTPNGEKVKLSPAMEDFLTGNRVRNAKATARALVARRMLNRRVWTLTEAGEHVAAQINADRARAAKADADQDATEKEQDTLAPVEKREFAVINTSRGDIRVHDATCADVARDRKRYGFAPEIIRAADQKTIVADFMSDFIEEGCTPADLDGDFVWVKCCGDLPWEAPAEPTPAPVTDEPGPFGVFEEGLCIASHSSRAIAEQFAAETRADDDGDSEVVVWPLCLEHPDAEQPRNTCEECTADGADEDTEEDDDQDDAEEPPAEDDQARALEHARRHGVAAGMHTTVHLNGRVVTGRIREFYMDGDLPMAHVPDEKTGRHAYVLITELTPPPAEGRVIAHQGTGRGVAPEHAEDAAAVRAARALAAAGLDLADLSQEYDPETCTATGYMIAPRGTDADGDAWVYVYYLTDGKTHDPATDRHPRAKLRAAGEALRSDGWGVDPLPGACVRAHLADAADPVPQQDRSVVTEIVTRVNARYTTGR